LKKRLLSIFCILTVLFSINVIAEATVQTDKADYPPGETVYISGSDFNPNTLIGIGIIRPDGVLDELETSSDLSGSFANAEYELIPERAMEGDYDLCAMDEENMACTTFTDTGGCSKSITRKCEDGTVVLNGYYSCARRLKLKVYKKVGSSYNYLKTCTMPDGTTGNNIECDTDLNSFKGKAELYYQYCSKYGCYWFKKETKYFTTTLTCPLPVCGDNIINQPDEICDGTDDDACQGQCKQDCTCPDDGCVIIKKTPDTARDDDGNTIHVATDNNQYERFYTNNGVRYAYFTWTNSIPSSKEIEEVIFKINHKDSESDMTIEWWNGASWEQVCDPTESTSDHTSTCDLTSYIDTVAEANNVQLRARMEKNGACHHDIDWVELTIEYCEPELFCGDNIVNQPSEECDGTDDASCPGLCTQDCTCLPPVNQCGDGELDLDLGEECDPPYDQACPGQCIPPGQEDQCTCPEPEELDFGDAPDSYQTLLASDGARHIIVPGLMLGALIDAEADGQPDASALGDDNNNIDDEDGVIFNGDGTVTVTPSAPGWLDVWVDMNFNGIFDHTSELVFSGVVAAGPVTFPIPTFIDTPTFYRFRLNSQGPLTPYGLANDGEVEDYRYAEFEEPPVPIPEFSTIGIIIALAAIGIGLTVIIKKRK